MPASKVELCYAVLTPFKFRSAHLKPPAFVQMSAEEARIYQDAGVLGGEDDAALPPAGDDGADEIEITSQVLTEHVDQAAESGAATVATQQPAPTTEKPTTPATKAAKAPAKKAAAKAAKKKAAK